MTPINTRQHRIEPGSVVDLRSIATNVDGGLNKDDAEDALKPIHKQLDDLQKLLFASESRGLLVVLQAMDTGGKDSTIRSVFGPLNPQGVRVFGFKVPSTLERSHDYLWRVHQHVPQRGMIGVFNRSHYEDVVVVRVKNLVAPERWQKRYDHILHFEQMLVDEGIAIVKFFLHISKAYQKDRLERRLIKPDKRWKFNPDDLKERARWDEYMNAYEHAIARCSTADAPWYVVPAETRWYRDLVIATVLRETLESFQLSYPGYDYDPATIVIE
ncbi:MAG: PPK2 family polyphosphate kinase [Phycisphaerales bacterium]